MIGFYEMLLMLLGIAPALAFWIAVIVLAAILLKRSGGRAEKFIIAGAAVKILAGLLTLPLNYLPVWLHRETSLESMEAIFTGGGLFISIIGMAGTICLIYAFWVKFKERNTGATPEMAPES